MPHKKIRIGAGAGYAGDRIEPAVELAQKGNIDYLVFECLAERTIALAQKRKKADPETGFDELLEERMLACLPVCVEKGIKIISNMGAANPLAAIKKTTEIAKSLGITGIKIAAVAGDDVIDTIQHKEYELLESKQPLSSIRSNVISANAYLGVKPIIEALQQQANIILTGRVADPALFLAPLIYEYDWPLDDYNLLGKGTVLGHLLECAGHITGGYFADPPYKMVPSLANLGFPIGEVQANGDFVITKTPTSGGIVTEATCKEQLLYEIHDPAHYLTPDVIADFSQVCIKEIGKDIVEVKGGKGKPKTGLLKTSVSYHDGFMGEGQISYGGLGALERGKLALAILKERFSRLGYLDNDIKFDLIGYNSLYGDKISGGNPSEVRVRVAGRTADTKAATKIGREVEALYTNGPAGGGGVQKSITEIVAIQSILLEEALVQPQITYIQL